MDSLVGLSVGDAFGEQYFVRDAAKLVARRALADGPWPWTDDTNMALSIVEVLLEGGELDQHLLARSFAGRYDRARGYGPAMQWLLPRLKAGADWRQLSPALFGGQGSFGNGAVMRVAPLGAYFAEDLERASHEAARSAEVTHAHVEAKAGASAIAVAAALAAQAADAGRRPEFRTVFDAVIRFLPDSEVKVGTAKAAELGPDAEVTEAVALLGNGSDISAQDTVPFVLWCAARHLDDFEEALWCTVSGLGDRDTTCAMVGGIVAAFTGARGVPAEWHARREKLPDWVSAHAAG
jgi:ADP-ribosylglycohydrolase